MTFAEIFDALPHTERALRVKHDDFPFTITNDWQVDAPHHWRVTSTDGKTLGLVFYRGGRKYTCWDHAAYSVTIRFDNATAPIVGLTDGRLHFLCHNCGRPDDAPIHGNDDPEWLPPVCHQCGVILAIPDEELRQAFADWNAGRAFCDNAGNYRVREIRGHGKVTSWNKVVDQAYPDPAVFEAAAKLNAGEAAR